MIYNITAFGARNDGATLNTPQIQAALDACTEAGGGTVLVGGGGRYLTGTLYLRDHTTLHIENGTVLVGSPTIEDYATDTHKNMYKNEPHMDRCLLFARDAHSVAIEGKGTIDGNGHREHFPRIRPMMIRLLNCSDIRIRDVTLINPAAWTSAWLYCRNIVVDGITIHSRVNGNGDGLDFDGCRNVRVSNSSFDTSDDSICLQASDPAQPCRDIVVTNCTFCSKWAGMRIGLLSRGNIESVAVSNCTFRHIQDSGLKIQMNEGGEMRNMVFSNLVMEDVPRPIFMTFCRQRACVDAPEELPPMKAMHSFVFSGIIIDNSAGDKDSGIFITGLPGHCIERIALRDVMMRVAGGGTAEDACGTDLPEYTPDVLGNWWPEFSLIGTLPAHGIYARHVRDLALSNISITTLRDDARNAVVLDDVNPGTLTALHHHRSGIASDHAVQ